MGIIRKKGWTLHTKDGNPVTTGTVVTDFRGDRSRIIDGTPPHKPQSCGFVVTAGGRELYTSVFSLIWTKDKEQDYSNLTDEEFDRLLAEVLDENPASALLSIPGIYEVVSEHFNDVVLDRWKEAQHGVLHETYLKAHATLIDEVAGAYNRALEEEHGTDLKDMNAAAQKYWDTRQQLITYCEKQNPYEHTAALFDAYTSLQEAVRQAGGDTSHFSLAKLQTMTVMELLSTLAPNGVRFTVEETSNAKS